MRRCDFVVRILCLSNTIECNISFSFLIYLYKGDYWALFYHHFSCKYFLLLVYAFQISHG